MAWRQHPPCAAKAIGAAITLIAYQEAQQMGYRHGVLFATDLGAPVYRRIGFRDVRAAISREQRVTLFPVSIGW